MAQNSPEDEKTLHTDPLYLSALASLDVDSNSAHGRHTSVRHTADLSRPSIAVLPFNNMSGDPEQEYFADGITEDIITELARNRGLFVIARNSSFTFKGASVNISEVGQKLGVRYVVEGSVRKAGRRVRVTAQVIEAASGSHIWAERYDRDLEDIFAVQDELTRSIVAAIPGHLESDFVKASRRKPTDSLSAYDHYLRGMEIVNRWRHDDFLLAKAEFELAVKLDPMFARGHAALGHMNLRIYWQSLDPRPLREASEGTELAARLDGADVRILSIRGMCLLATDDYDGALDVFERAFQLSPDDPELNIRMAYYLISVGQPEEALERAQFAIRSSPLFLPPSHREAVGLAHMMAQRYEEAIRNFKAISSADSFVHVWTAGCLAKLGHFEESRAQCEMATAINPNWPTEDWGKEYRNLKDKEHVRELVRIAMEALERKL